MAARPDFATDLRAMCKRHYLGTNLAQRAATLNDLQRHLGTPRPSAALPALAAVVDGILGVQIRFAKADTA
jgi:hypothetical protein